MIGIEVASIGTYILCLYKIKKNKKQSNEKYKFYTYL